MKFLPSRINIFLFVAGNGGKGQGHVKSHDHEGLEWVLIEGLSTCNPILQLKGFGVVEGVRKSSLEWKGLSNLFQ